MPLNSNLNALYQAMVGSGNVAITTYPTAVDPLTDVTGITLTADAAGSKYGAYVQIIAAAGIAVPFWVCGISVNTASAIDQYQVRLGQGAGAAEVAFADSGIIDMTAVTANAVPVPLMFPVRIAAATRIAGKVACLDAVARTLNVSLSVATGVGT